MLLIEHNLLPFVFALIVGIIPHKAQVRKKLSKQKGSRIELEAYLWRFTLTERDWSLHITGVCLLKQRMRDTLDQ